MLVGVVNLHIISVDMQDFTLPLHFSVTGFSSCQNLILDKQKEPISQSALLICSSGWQDSNLRPPGPKPGTLTGLCYTPNNYFLFSLQFIRTTVSAKNFCEGRHPEQYFLFLFVMFPFRLLPNGSANLEVIFYFEIVG